MAERRWSPVSFAPFLLTPLVVGRLRRTFVAAAFAVIVIVVFSSVWR
jgi:hypothetical protein